MHIHKSGRMYVHKQGTHSWAYIYIHILKMRKNAARWFSASNGGEKKNKKQTTSARLHLLACTFIYTLVHTYVCIHVKNVNMYALFFSLIPPTADKRTERTDKSVNTQKAHFSQCTLYMYIHVHHTYRCIYVCSFVRWRLRKLYRPLFST